MPAIIVENDDSQWNDDTGALYHFPRRYLAALTPGEPVIYYKGRQRDSAYAASRMTPDPHYFGTARIGRVYPDRSSAKGDHFATIEAYAPFEHPVPLRDEAGRTLEPIPAAREANYWRDGVRSIPVEVYDRIVRRAVYRSPESSPAESPTNWPERELQSGSEGAPHQVYTTVYERDPRLRVQALAIHGFICFGCRFNFEERYGPHGAGFIHVHHVKPLHAAGGAQTVNPETDLVPLCPNCHAMVHRRKQHTLTLEELRAFVR